MSRLFPIIAIALAIGLSAPLQAAPYPWAHLPLPEQAEAIQVAIKKLKAQDHDEIIDLAGLLYQIGETLDVASIRAEAIRQQAWAYGKKQDLTKSARYYFELEALYRQLNDSAGLGKAYFNIGKLFARAHEYDDALRYYELARDRYAAAGLEDRVSLALYQMAWCYLDKKAPETASGLLQKALEICPREKKSQHSMIYNLLGWSAKDLRDYQTARDYYRESLSLWDESKLPAKKQAIAINNIGESFLLEQRYDSAVLYLQKALDIKATLNNPEFSLSTTTLMADIDYRLGQPLRAMARLEKGMHTVDPTHLSKEINDALKLFTDITGDPKQANRLPNSLLKLGIQWQRQQFLSLRKLKEDLDKFSIKAGKDLYTREMESQELQASLLSQQYQKYTWGTASAFLLFIALAGLVYALVQRRYKARAEQEKTDFVNEQMKNYDQRILQMLIVKAEYEEIKSKLKNDFGLGDGDFSG